MFTALANLLVKLVESLPGLRRDLKRKQRLREELAKDAYEWRSIEVLARAAAAPEEKTRDLLISIGAQRSIGEKEVWQLPKRAG